MDFSKLTAFQKIYPLFIEQFETFTPVDDNASITDKMNKVIEHLNSIGKLSTQVVNEWNKVMSWTMNDGIIEATNDKIEQLISTGKFDELLETMFTQINTSVDDFKSDINTQVDDFKSDVNQSLAGFTSDLAEKAKKVWVDITEAPFKAKGDGVADDTTAILNAVSTLVEGQTLYFPPGNYLMKQPLVLSKYMTLKGADNGWTGGTVITFDGCNGLVPTKTYIQIEDIEISGINKPTRTIADIQSANLGTIGLKLENSSSSNTSGVSTKNVRITGFNVAIAILMGAGGTWSGAYRDFFQTRMNYNDVGIYAVDGATHNKFFGGVLATSALYGIYTKNSVFYSEIEMIGTTCELNGTWGGNYPSNDYAKYGVYAGDKSRVKFTNGYVESQRHFSDNGGTIIFNACHCHPSTTGYFSRGSGTIISNESLNNYKVIKRVKADLKTKFTFTNCTASDVTGIATTGAAVTVTATGTAAPSMTMVFNEGTLKTIVADELEYIKFSMKVKVRSGKTAPGFGIVPYLRATSINGSRDSFSADRTLPLEVYQWDRTPYEKIEFYYYVRRVAGQYLDPADFLSYVDFGLLLYNGTPDYTTQNLIVDIYDPIVEFYTRSDVNLN
jgi:hypothetical protein